MAHCTPLDTLLANIMMASLLYFDAMADIIFVTLVFVARTPPVKKSFVRVTSLMDDPLQFVFRFLRHGFKMSVPKNISNESCSDFWNLSRIDKGGQSIVGAIAVSITEN